ARIGQPQHRGQGEATGLQQVVARDEGAPNSAGAEQRQPAGGRRQRAAARGTETGAGDRAHARARSAGSGAAASAAASAAATSATRSSLASMPIDRRSSPSEMPALARASGVIAAWVMDAGCATR